MIDQTQQNPPKTVVLSLGTVVFDLDARPEEVQLGGEQMLSVLQFPGGYKEVQMLGHQERAVAWSGVFEFEKAYANVQKLDEMCRRASVYELKIGDLPPRLAIIKKFHWSFRKRTELPYEIELEILPNMQSVLYTDPVYVGQGDQGAAVWRYPNDTYTAVAGDTLWTLALRFYGHGEHFRKIADANNITDPSASLIGRKLVIPR